MKRYVVLIFIKCIVVFILADSTNNMAFIKGGTFKMGASPTDPYISKSETPLHTVTLSDYYIGKYEVTHKSYIQFLNEENVDSTGSKNGVEYVRIVDTLHCAVGFKNGKFYFKKSKYIKKEQCAMAVVTWYGAAAYCNWLSKKENRTACYNSANWKCDFKANGYRLPTEAEWEYACRAGSSTSYFWGNEMNPAYCWQDYEREDAPKVGRKRPNSFGLYDMSGSVWEWCQDWYDYDYYKNSPENNPTGPSSSYHRSIRGGSWRDESQNQCSGSRYSNHPLNSSYCWGFRVALVK